MIENYDFFLENAILFKDPVITRSVQFSRWLCMLKGNNIEDMQIL